MLQEQATKIQQLKPQLATNALMQLMTQPIQQEVELRKELALQILDACLILNTEEAASNVINICQVLERLFHQMLSG